MRGDGPQQPGEAEYARAQSKSDGSALGDRGGGAHHGVQRAGTAGRAGSSPCSLQRSGAALWSRLGVEERNQPQPGCRMHGTQRQGGEIDPYWMRMRYLLDGGRERLGGSREADGARSVPIMSQVAQSDPAGRSRSGILTLCVCVQSPCFPSCLAPPSQRGPRLHS